MSSPSSLEQKTILVTRSLDQADEFCLKLTEKGAIPISIPLISIQEVMDIYEWESIMKYIDKCNRIIFTSKNGVECFFSILKKKGLTLMPNVKFAVVGLPTAKSLSDFGYTADFIPSKYTAECLVEEMGCWLTKQDKILFVKGRISRKIIPDYLKRQDFHFKELTVYDTIPDVYHRETLIDLLEKRAIDVITFTSPSTIDSFVRLLDGTSWREWIKDITIAVIGTTSEKGALKHRIPVQVVPKQFTIVGLVEEMENYFNR